jgi:hypothetical protein
MEIEDIRIERYQPQAGDVLLVRVTGTVSDAESERIKSVVQGQCGDGVGVLVAGSGVDLTVLRAEAVAEAAP